jgi:hypothetical protein
MSRSESITIREVESSDLETFYEHQLDPEAIRMAAFVCIVDIRTITEEEFWHAPSNSM